MNLGTRYIQYAEEKTARAHELGWPEGYEAAIYDLYVNEELSFRQTADWFGVNQYAVCYRLKQHRKITPRPRGGRNHVRR